jgi:hypothetical protein
MLCQYECIEAAQYSVVPSVMNLRVVLPDRQSQLVGNLRNMFFIFMVI